MKLLGKINYHFVKKNGEFRHVNKDIQFLFCFCCTDYTAHGRNFAQEKKITSVAIVLLNYRINKYLKDLFLK